MSNPVGRPTLLNEAMLEKAEHYMIEGYKEVENIVPSVAGLCCYLGISKSTAYEWAGASDKDQIRKQFSDTLEAIQTKQEMLLINGGLSQVYSAPITKLMLSNHGYSEKLNQDITTNGESINKPAIDTSKLTDEQLRSLDAILSQASETGTIET